MDTIKKFLASHNITAHTIAIVFSLLTTAFFQNQQFHDFVMQMFTRLPTGLKEFIVMVIGLWAWYKNNAPKREIWTDAQRSAELNNQSDSATAGH